MPKISRTKSTYSRKSITAEEHIEASWSTVVADNTSSDGDPTPGTVLNLVTCASHLLPAAWTFFLVKDLPFL